MQAEDMAELIIAQLKLNRRVFHQEQQYLVYESIIIVKVKVLQSNDQIY
jgi:hypothetical protein